MNEIIERVARAIWMAIDPDERTISDWQNLPGVDVSEVGVKAVMIEAARAAVEAMREPTEAMIRAADGAAILQWSLEPGEGLDGVNMLPAWKAMIDAALKQ